MNVLFQIFTRAWGLLGDAETAACCGFGPSLSEPVRSAICRLLSQADGHGRDRQATFELSRFGYSLRNRRHVADGTNVVVTGGDDNVALRLSVDKRRLCPVRVTAAYLIFLNFQ